MKHATRPVTRYLPTLLAAGFLAAGCSEGDDRAGSPSTVRAAVAGNFALPQRELARLFRAATGIEVITSLGSTGLLYAQITNGAPFDIFLAADAERPRRLEDTGMAVSGSRFTYAVGRLVLYAPQWEDASSARLVTTSFETLVIANPKTAPYGAAAQSTVTAWHLWESLQDRIVRAENVAQAYQIVASGAAEVGIVALSQMTGRETTTYAILPDSLHQPIRQDAVLLLAGERNQGARAFLDFLRSDEGRRVIVAFGYDRS